MIPTEQSVNFVLNRAITYLESADIPVTLQSHYDMCNAWYHVVLDAKHPTHIAVRNSLRVATERLRRNLSELSEK